MSLQEVICKLYESLGTMDVTNIKTDMTEDTYHSVKHRFREVIIVPYIAIKNNISFFTNRNGEHYVTTSDNVKCRVAEWNEIHMCEMGNDIKELYHMELLPFIMKWYQHEPGMDSMHFIKMKLEKIKENGQ